TFITGGVSYGECACASGTRGNASTTTASQIPTLTGHAGPQLHLVFAAAVMTGVPSGRGSSEAAREPAIGRKSDGPSSPGPAATIRRPCRPRRPRLRNEEVAGRG